MARSFVDAFGRLVPTRVHDPGAVALVAKTPTSVPTTSRPCISTTSFAGASGRLPERSVHVAPPSVDSNTWPTPAPGIHRRENAPYVTKTWPGSLASTRNDVGIRLGRFFAVTVCHAPP